jgi:signal transduction histidine kinase
MKNQRSNILDMNHNSDDEKLTQNSYALLKSRGANIATDSDNPYSLDSLALQLVLSMERNKMASNINNKNEELSKENNLLSKDVEHQKHITSLQTDFVSLASHEFKTPLAIIKASADVLSRVCKADEKVQGQVQKINGAVDRMLELVTSTLNLAKLESGKVEFSPAPINISNLVNEIITRHQYIDDDVIFNSDLDKSNTLCSGDRSLLDQIFSNLLSNAIKYSNGNTIIDVTSKVKDGYLIVTVKDNGIGIPEEGIDKLFYKFFRAENAIVASGTGIGLYLVKEFVKLHKGKISVTSQINVGSSFTVKLPIIT